MDEDLMAAYAAGLFDGEGCITTNWPKRAQIVIEIKMVSKPTIERFASVFGGRCVTAYEDRRGRRKQWQCRMYGISAVKALEVMMPFLCEKQRQAELALYFYASKDAEQRDKINEALKAEKRKSYD